VFIVVLGVNFDAGTFSDNFFVSDDLGSMTEQVKNTMLITTFVCWGS
jgi:arginine:ornithine antiporter/lysine permease